MLGRPSAVVVLVLLFSASAAALPPGGAGTRAAPGWVVVAFTSEGGEVDMRTTIWPARYPDVAVAHLYDGDGSLLGGVSFQGRVTRHGVLLDEDVLGERVRHDSRIAVHGSGDTMRAGLGTTLQPGRHYALFFGAGTVQHLAWELTGSGAATIDGLASGDDAFLFTTEDFAWESRVVANAAFVSASRIEDARLGLRTENVLVASFGLVEGRVLDEWEVAADGPGGGLRCRGAWCAATDIGGSGAAAPGDYLFRASGRAMGLVPGAGDLSLFGADVHLPS